MSYTGLVLLRGSVFASFSRRFWLASFLYLTAVGFLLFGYKYLDFVARGHVISPLAPFIEEMTGAYSAYLLLAPGILLARRFPLNRRRWLAPLAAHWAIATTLAAAQTTLMAVSRAILFPIAGLGPYDYGKMPTRYVMEYCNQLIVYAVLVSLLFVVDNYRAARDREVNSAQLERQLAQAQLQNLRLQLQPHFLFNSLNTISSVMYEDVAAADTMLNRLSDLLRLTLAASNRQEVPLQDEVRILELYLHLMRARLEDRLAVSLDIETGLESALVPQLILQPLVENSILHGVSPATSSVEVSVSARRQNGSVHLEVRDRGPGIAAPPSSALGKGIGLTNTAERLQRLYGQRQSMEIANAPGGGLRISLQLPYHTSA